MIKLSKASKMPCKSFSLEAIQTCPGMFKEDGAIKEVCQGCYAVKGSYTWPVVKKVREDNLAETLKDSFVDNMVEMLYKQKGNYFRWFDSGDVYSKEFLCKIHAICKQTPHIKHWIPTKSRELFSNTLWKLLEALPNVKVRYSSPSINGAYEAKHGATVVPARDASAIEKELLARTKQLFICPSSLPQNKGKCNSCRACWSKKIDVIAYVKH